MFFTLKRNVAQPVLAYLAKMIFFAFLPSMLLSLLAALVIQGKAPSPYLAGDASIHFIWQIIVTGFLVPFFETFMLVYPTVLACNATEKDSIAALIGTLPLTLLHVFVHWAKPITVFFSFYVQAYAYLELRKTGQSAKASFLFAFSIHAFINTAGVLALYLWP